MLRVLGMAALDDPAQGRRDIWSERADRLGLLIDDRSQRLDGALAVERSPARRHLVEHRPERELIRPIVDRRALRLLGRHVADSSDDHALARAVVRQRGAARAFRRRRLEILRQTEVRDFRRAVSRKKDVVRLQIAVNDAARVRDRKGLRRRDRQIEQPLDRKRAALEQCRQRSSQHELRDDVGGAGLLPDVVDGHDVGMRKRRRGLCLRLEPPESPRVLAGSAPGRIFRATSRASRVSRARYTSPIPPAPSSDTNLVGPQARARLEASRSGRSSVRSCARLCPDLALRVDDGVPDARNRSAKLPSRIRSPSRKNGGSLDAADRPRRSRFGCRDPRAPRLPSRPGSVRGAGRPCRRRSRGRSRARVRRCSRPRQDPPATRGRSPDRRTRPGLIGAPARASPQKA